MSTVFLQALANLEYRASSCHKVKQMVYPLVGLFPFS